MSTQQQIDQYNAAIQQKQQEKAGQETILRIQQEQLAKAETARIDAELAAQRAQNSGASAEQVAALQRQARLADQAESDARVAASQTSSNIEKLDGSIRFNTSNRDQFQSSLPAQGVQASTADDVAVNARANAAEIAPAPVPAANAPGAVENIGAGLGLLDPQQRAEIITPAPAPVPRSAIEEGGDAEAQAALTIQSTTAESVPLTDAESAALFEEAEAEEQVQVTAPAPVAPTLSTVWDSETGSYGVWADPPGEFQQTGFATEEQAQAAIDDPTGAVAALDEESSAAAEAAAAEDPDGADALAALEQEAAKVNTINQATLNSVYKKGRQC